MNLYCKSVRAFHDIKELLLLLLELMALAVEVLDDLGGAIKGNQSRDVVQGRVACEKRRVRRS